VRGEVRITGPTTDVRVVGVDDGVEVRVPSMRDAWSMRGLLSGLPTAEPLSVVDAWWRLSGVTLHLVIAGRRVAVARPGEAADGSGMLPPPWRLNRRAALLALGRAALGRG
jgi:hypothetical protein